LINGEAITAIRTGAASGLATDLLANKDSDSLAIIGAGVQAFTQFEAVCNVRNIRRCIVFDVNKEKIETFIEKANSLFPVEFKSGTNKTELREYDIICTTSNAAGVLFEDKDIKDGTHINAIGAYRPDMIEIPGKTVARSLVIVDSREAALAEAGDIIQAINNKLIDSTHIHCELGELAAGLKPGRSSADQITLFKSVGLAVQDLAAASIIYNDAVKLNIGTEIEL
jgi:ornithine cyclodeaminase/alanine dehydrogenase-like protein (mu-crystallin family)